MSGESVISLSPDSKLLRVLDSSDPPGVVPSLTT